MKTKGKILPLMLAAMMVFMLLPMTAHAASTTVNTTAQLQTALAGNYDTIVLGVDNLVYTNKITLTNKNVTFNLNGKTLNVSPASGTAVEVYNGSLDLTGAGALNVAASGTGVYALYVHGNSHATVTSVTAVGSGCSGILAIGGTTTVTGNIQATGTDSMGVWSQFAGTQVTVGSVDTDGLRSRGVYTTGDTNSGGAVTVNGDITVSGVQSEGVETVIGTVTVNGPISAEGDASRGVNAYGGTATVNDGVTVNDTVAGNPGSGIWSSGGAITVTGVVTALGNGNYGAYAENADARITVHGDVDANGSGSRGVYAKNGQAAVDGDVEAWGDGSYGVYTESAGAVISVGDSVTVNGDGCYGAYAVDGKVTVTGAVSATDNVTSPGSKESYAVYAKTFGEVNAGSVSANGYMSYGVYVEGGKATVTGDVSANGFGSNGIDAKSNASVHAASITSAGGLNFGGHATGNGTTIAISGNVSMDGGGCMGLRADDRSVITVGGGVTAVNNLKYCVLATSSGAVTVNGNVTADRGSGTYTGAPVTAIQAEYSTITVHGNVTATGSNIVGVISFSGGTATIDGTLTAPQYICVNIISSTDPDTYIIKTAGEGANGTGAYAPYLVYSDTDHTAGGTVYIRKRLSVAFDSRPGGSAVSGQTIAYDGLVTKPADPQRAYYTFSGWYRESACENEWKFTSDKVTANTILYAKWTAVPYSISYALDGGESSPANPTSYTVESAITLNNPTKQGNTFTGWSGTGISETSMNVTIPAGSTGDRSYTAHWSIGSYTVNFDSQGGSGASSQTVANGGRVTMPGDPTRLKYDFGGWYKEPNCINGWNFASDTVTGNITLYAKWTAQKPGNTLKAIKLSAGKLSKAFSPKTTSYTVNLKETDAGVTLTPVKAYDGATMTIDGKKAAIKTVKLSNGKSATVTVKVTWNKKTATYKLTVKRPKSTNNLLASLKASAGSLSPAFNPSVTSYTLALPVGVSKVTIKATQVSPLATITPASKIYTLKKGQTVTATVKVKSQSGKTRTYTIKITRANS